MQIEYLREFVCFSKTLSISKTAKELFITQSTMSKHIRQIESDINAQLVVTQGKQMHLTAAGTHFANKARSIVDDYESLVEECQRLALQEPIAIRAQNIPFQQDKAALAYISFTQQIAANADNATVKYAMGSRRNFAESIKEGCIDIALVYRCGDEKEIRKEYQAQGFRVHLLANDSLGVWCSESLYPGKTHIGFEELENATITLPPNSSAPVYNMLNDLENLFDYRSNKSIVNADAPIEYIFASSENDVYLWPFSFLDNGSLTQRPGMKPIAVDGGNGIVHAYAIAKSHFDDPAKESLFSQAFANQKLDPTDNALH